MIIHEHIDWIKWKLKHLSSTAIKVFDALICTAQSDIKTLARTSNLSHRSVARGLSELYGNHILSKATKDKYIINNLKEGVYTTPSFIAVQLTDDEIDKILEQELHLGQ